MNNKEIIKYFYEVVVSENLLDELSQYISADCVQKIGKNEIFIGTKSPAKWGVQMAGMNFKTRSRAVKKTYPDYMMKIIRQFEDDENVISEFIMRGTHKGEFSGTTPTNKVIEMTGVDIGKIVNGKIVEHGGAVNAFDAFGKNGLIIPV